MIKLKIYGFPTSGKTTFVDKIRGIIEKQMRLMYLIDTDTLISSANESVWKIRRQLIAKEGNAGNSKYNNFVPKDAIAAFVTNIVSMRNDMIMVSNLIHTFSFDYYFLFKDVNTFIERFKLRAKNQKESMIVGEHELKRWFEDARIAVVSKIREAGGKLILLGVNEYISDHLPVEFSVINTSDENGEFQKSILSLGNLNSIPLNVRRFK